jgi:hypothetical protein
MNSTWTRSFKLLSLLGLTAVAVIPTVGCTVDIGGQTLPSAYYLKDDIQYFPPGYEFKLQREADEQKAYREEVEQSMQNRRGAQVRNY